MLTSLASLKHGNLKKSETFMTIVNIEVNLNIFWIARGISMKFSGKMWLMIILKITKERLSPLSLWKTYFWKNHWGGQIDPLPHFRAESLLRFYIATNSCKQIDKFHELIFDKIWETSFLAQFGPFSLILPYDFFFKKSGSITFKAKWYPNYIKKSTKFLHVVLVKNARKIESRQTD